MTDRELLERAAKAAGMRINFHPCASYNWNPLTDDGNALRLSSKLHINITHSAHAVRAWTDDDAPVMVDETVFVVDESKRIVAMCHAVTRAAAAIAESK